MKKQRMPQKKKKIDLDRMDKRTIWHPFTQMRDYCREDHPVIARGKGSYLYDTRGRRYLDGVSSLWVNVHGHRKAQIDHAIVAQVKKICHSTLLGLTNVPAILLAEQLLAAAPAGLTRVFYSDNGSTAVDIALKIAFQFLQQHRPATRRKQKFLSLVNAYHGDTIGSVSVGGIDLFHKIYHPLLFTTLRAPSPYCYRCPLDRSHPQCGLACLDALENILKKHSREIAAFIIEPLVQGAAGMLVFPAGYLKACREMCTRYNVLMIADEVAVGFGKTGTLFACEQEQVRPDLLCVAKGITGGTLPLAATLATEKIYRAFLGRTEDLKTFYHGHTYTGNPVACAAACASLAVFRDERVLEKLQPKIELLKNRLREFRNLKHVGDIRQCGFMVGIELVENTRTKKPYPLKKRMGHRVIRAALRHGVVIRPLGDVIILMPPLSISIKELECLLDVVFASIQSVTERKPFCRKDA